MILAIIRSPVPNKAVVSNISNIPQENVGNVEKQFIVYVVRT